jgi:hypothetical protein
MSQPARIVYVGVAHARRRCGRGHSHFIETRPLALANPADTATQLGQPFLKGVDLNRRFNPYYLAFMDTTTSIRTPAGLRASALGLVLVGGLVAGALDLSFAFIFYGLQGVPAQRILQLIASGVLGRGSFQMGLGSAALGAFFHFLISVCAAGIYFLASLRLPFLTRRVIVAGATFGILMFLAMHFVVVPLSAVKSGPVKIGSVIGELCSHMFLFGMPIAYAAARAARRRAKPLGAE